jgi:hypothetical protein
MRQQIIGIFRAADRFCISCRKSNIRDSSNRTLQMTRAMSESTSASASFTELAHTSSRCSPRSSRKVANASGVPATSKRGRVRCTPVDIAKPPRSRSPHVYATALSGACDLLEKPARRRWRHRLPCPSNASAHPHGSAQISK